MQQDPKNNVQVIGPTAGEHAIHRGDTMEQIQTVYHTAVRVQKPRELVKVQEAVLAEAELAGELFYYSWKVQPKKGPPKIIDGITVHAAMAIARYWGNCVVNTEREREGARRVKYTSDFIDLESGFTLRRIYSMHLADAPARFKHDPSQVQRWYDMQDQKAQSISQRNVVQKGVPHFLVDKVKRTAREAALKGIKGNEEQAIRATTAEFADTYGVKLETLEKHLETKQAHWTPQMILQLRSILQAFNDGIETPTTVFEEGGTGPASDTTETPAEESGPSDDEILAQLKEKVGDIKWLDEYVKAASDFAGQSVGEYVQGILEDEKALGSLPNQVGKWAKKHGKDKPAEQEKKEPPKEQSPPEEEPPKEAAKAPPPEPPNQGQDRGEGKDKFTDVYQKLGRAGIKKTGFAEYLKEMDADPETNEDAYVQLMTEIRRVDKKQFDSFVKNFKEWNEAR